MQRFVAPGYHLTHLITAFADTAGMALTRYHPDAGTHFGSVNAFPGASFVVLGLMLFARQRNAATS